METIKTRDAFNASTRQGPARAIRVILCSSHDYITFSGECRCAKPDELQRFAVVGTDYGWLHNAQGEKRIFHSARSAYRAAQTYRERE